MQGLSHDVVMPYKNSFEPVTNSWRNLRMDSKGTESIDELPKPPYGGPLGSVRSRNELQSSFRQYASVWTLPCRMVLSSSHQGNSDETTCTGNQRQARN
jgi:hypothetical protein